jgi:hypothetical protein
MATLSSSRRKSIPKSQMGVPGKATKKGGAVSGTYPMPDKSHAANAKARATQQVKKGNLSSSQAATIRAKANRVLGKSGTKAGARSK